MHLHKSYLTYRIILFSTLFFIFIGNLNRLVKNMDVYRGYSHSYVGVFNNPELIKIKNSIKSNQPYRVVHHPGGLGGAFFNMWSVGYGLEDAAGFGTMLNRRYIELWDIMSFNDYKSAKYARTEKYRSSALNMEFNIDLNLNAYRAQQKPINFNYYHNNSLLSLMNVKYILSHTLI